MQGDRPDAGFSEKYGSPAPGKIDAAQAAPGAAIAVRHDDANPHKWGSSQGRPLKAQKIGLKEQAKRLAQRICDGASSQIACGSYPQRDARACRGRLRLISQPRVLAARSLSRFPPERGRAAERGRLTARRRGVLDPKSNALIALADANGAVEREEGSLKLQFV